MRLLSTLLLFLLPLLNGTLSSAADVRAPLELRIVHVSDLDRMEARDGKGGVAKLATLVGELRSQGGALLVTHGGDTLSPSVMSSFDRGRHMIDLLNHLPLDLLVLGNHEFDFGPEVLKERLAETQFPVLASNLVTADAEPFPGVEKGLLLPFDKWNIGVFGLLTPETHRSSNPGDLAILPELEVAPQEAARLRDAGADLVIALAHSDWHTDVELVRQGAVDLILGGHDHILHLLAPPNGTALVEPGAQAEQVAVITLRLEDGSEGVEWSASYEFLSTEYLEPDAEMADRIQAYEARVEGELSRELATTKVQLDSRRSELRTGEAAFGNLIADALREETGADVALQNAGGVRAERLYPAGSRLTVRDVVAELPFLNRVELLEVNGDTLRQVLEHGLSELGQMSGRFPQVSGMEASYDPTRAPGKRVLEISVQGEPLDSSRTYRLAVNGFLGGGGDGYDMLIATPRLPHPADDLADSAVVARYLKRVGAIAPRVDGRLRAVE